MHGRLAGLLVLLGAISLASAQDQVIPALSAAGQEYGVSGSYSKQKDTAGNNTSEFSVLGHWGYLPGIAGLEGELETGYARHAVGALDSTGNEVVVGGNILLNVPISDGFAIFGIGGYAYDHFWGSRVVAGETVTAKATHGFVQYGAGVKWLLVPNAALRVDYRVQRGAIRGLGSLPNRDRDLILIGISVLQ